MPTYKRVVTIRRAEYIPQGTGGGRRQYEMVILSISASSAVSFRVAIIREKTIYTLIYRPPAASKVLVVAKTVLLAQYAPGWHVIYE